jgi:outer membrane protein
MGVAVFMTVEPAFAASAKIGIIDMQKIMQESKAAKDAKGMFLLDLEAKRGTLKSEEDKVRAMETELRDKGEKASDEAKEKLTQAVKKLRRLKNDMEDELKEKDADLSRRLFGEIRKIVDEFLKKKKYTVILDKRTAVSFDEKFDVTDQIMKMYDAKKR